MSDAKVKALELAHNQCMLNAKTRSLPFKAEEVVELAKQYESYIVGSKVENESQLLVESAARAAHEAIRTLQIQNKESNIASPWETVGEDIKESCFIGVKRVIEDPNITNAELHDSWIKTKEAQGWTYGDVRSEELKTHPCMVPYNELPEFQKLKDAMFRNIVKAVLGL